jgi:hypothetical protein
MRTHADEQPDLVMDNATKACLDEAVAIVAADKPAGQESYDPLKLLQLGGLWSEGHRFPREFNLGNRGLTTSRRHPSRPRAVLAILCRLRRGAEVPPGNGRLDQHRACGEG